MISRNVFPCLATFAALLCDGDILAVVDFYPVAHLIEQNAVIQGLWHRYLLFHVLTLLSPLFPALRAAFRERVAPVGVPAYFPPAHDKDFFAVFAGDAY